jgi:hypothetical protein
METAQTTTNVCPDVGVSPDVEKSLLEKEKLRTEIQDIRDKGNWENRITKHVPAITAIVAIGALSFGIYQFRAQQGEAFRRQESELKRANDAKEQEFRKPFWEKQLHLYFDASEAASTLATSTDKRRIESAQERFWQLYWGPLAVVEDAGLDLEDDKDAKVEAAMVAFGNCLDGTDVCDQQEKRRRSLILAHTLRESIGKSWDVQMADLKGKYNKASPPLP